VIDLPSMDGFYCVRDFLVAEKKRRDKQRQETEHLVALKSDEDEVRQQRLEQNEIKGALDNKGRSSLHLAAWTGQQDMVEQLLEKNQQIDERDLQGRTALHLAALAGKYSVVQILLERKAQTDVVDSDDRTALHLTAWAGFPVVVNLLLRCLKEFEGVPSPSPSDTAYKDEELRKKNAEGKSKVLDAKDINGWTPLSLAAGNGRVSVVRLLLKRGADLLSLDKKCRTALVLAGENNQEKIRKLILEEWSGGRDSRDTVSPWTWGSQLPQFDSNCLPDLLDPLESKTCLPIPPLP